MNYDSTQVGVPYVRVPRITIDYTNNAFPKVTIAQSLAVKLADGTLHEMAGLPEILATFDMATDGNKPIPLVNPTTGASMDAQATLNQVMLFILGVVRQEQLKVNT